MSFSLQVCKMRIVGRGIRVDINTDSIKQEIRSASTYFGFPYKIAETKAALTHSVSSEKKVMK